MAETLWFDSGWPPALADLTKYAGFLFYLAPGDNRRPDPSKAKLQEYLDAGLDLAVIWQAGKVDIAAGGFDLGVDHARRANADADLKGVGSWEPIIYACDANRKFAEVEQYYRGVLSVPGRPVGAYGSGNLIDDLHDHLGIQWFMQAAAKAWNTPVGYVSPHIQFLQRDPNVPVGNSFVDQVVPLAPYPTRKAGPRMALTADQRLAAYRAEGLQVEEILDWRNHNRNSKGPWGPDNGTVNHHTGSDLTGDHSVCRQYAVNVLYNGYSGLPGPLCQDGLCPHGIILTIGNGRCNHAGGGDPAVLQKVIADTVPMDSELHPTKGNTDGVDGNARFYGLEIMRSGTKPIPRVQYVAQVKWNAAIDRARGWSAQSNIGHREWSKDKPDPGLTNLATLRQDIAAALALPPGKWGADPVPPPKPDPVIPTPSQEDDDMFIFTRKSDGASFASTPTGVRQLDGEMYGTLINVGVKVTLENMDDGPCAALLKALGGIVPAGSDDTQDPPDDDAPEARSEEGPEFTDVTPELN